MPKLLPGRHEMKMLQLVVLENTLAYIEYEIVAGVSKGVIIRQHLDNWSTLEPRD